MAKKRTDNFDKFVKKPKGSAVKEKIRQEKKKEKKERAEAIERFYAKKREERLLQRGINPADVNKTAKPNSRNRYAKDVKAASPTPTNDKKTSKYPKEQSPADGRKDGTGAKGKFNNKDRKPTTGKSFDRNNEDRKEHFKGKAEQPAAPNEKFTRTKSGDKKDFANRKEHSKSTDKKEFTNRKEHTESKVDRPAKQATEGKKDYYKNKAEQSAPAAPVYQYVNKQKVDAPEQMPLNKFVAHSGVCGRREAAELVKNGKVSVNGTVEINPATKVSEADVVKVSGKKITPSKNFVYILLNKPKDYITTAEDPQGRKTVLDLVKQATTERVYPVGRLDRNTSGVLLLTNDGDLAQKLSHPKHEIKKVYEVKLDRVLSKGDMDKIAAGITLEDGFIAPDVIAYADSKDKSIIGIEIHSGRNRIVRRIFEHLKYDVKALDRVMFAGLTKKDVQRGTWRFLKEKEVRLLKYMNQSFTKKK